MAGEEKKIVLQGTQEELMRIIPQLVAFHQILERFDSRGLYTMPDITFHDSIKFTPKIKLSFYQLQSETRNRFAPATGEISYRVVGETPQTFTPANARTRAERIKQLFCEPELFTWRKGKLRASYSDQSNGYHFILLVRSEAEARRIITQVMAIEGKSPEWENLALHESRATFPDVTPTRRIYGEERKLPRRRPTEDIKFRYAELYLHGLTKAVRLVDTVGKPGIPVITVS